MVSVFLLSRCSTCMDCTTFDNEPYVNMEFRDRGTGELINVRILEINQQESALFDRYLDTTSTFILPLSMNQNVSQFQIEYSNPSDSSLHSSSFQISYERRFERTPENNLRVNCYGTMLDTFEPDSVLLICNDTLGICFSNEADLRIYF